MATGGGGEAPLPNGLNGALQQSNSAGRRASFDEGYFNQHGKTPSNAAVARNQRPAVSSTRPVTTFVDHDVSSYTHPPLSREMSLPDINFSNGNQPIRKKQSGLKGFFKSAFSSSSSTSSSSASSIYNGSASAATSSGIHHHHPPPAAGGRRPSHPPSNPFSSNGNPYYLEPYSEYDGGAPMQRVSSKASLEGGKSRKSSGNLGKWWSNRSHDTSEDSLSTRSPSYTNLARLNGSNPSPLLLSDIHIDDSVSVMAPLTSGSAWVAPDSWNIQPDSPSDAHPAALDPIPPHALKSTADVLLWTDEMYEANGIKPAEEGTIRVFYPSGYFSTITCRMTTTTKELLLAASKKQLITDWTKYNLVVCRNGLERNLDMTDSPLLMVWRWLQQVGYSVATKPDPLEWANHTYLCSFHFKETILSYDSSQRFASMVDVSLAGSNIVAIPVFLFRQADQVERLDLSENLNIKEIPLDLSQSMTSLLSLSLAGNEIYQVPKSLHALTSLAILDLSRNRIQSLHSSGLENLVNLIQLDLASNLIEVFPAEIAQNLKRIQVLNLSNNRIINFPTDLCRYVGESLQRLDMSFNAMRATIPEVIGELKALKYLRLHGNAFYGGLPRRFTELKELVEVDLRGNQLGELKGEEIMVMDVLAELPKLNIIKMDGNRIRQAGKWASLSHRHHGPAAQDVDDIFPEQWQMDHEVGTPIDEADDDDPRVLLEIQNATYLSLAYQADLYSARPLIFRIINSSGSLTHLNISYCGIETLPHTIFERLQGLTYLDVSGNALRKLPPLSGTAGDGLFKLQELHAGNNNLMEIPDDVGELEELAILDVQANQLVELPPDIWRCKSLRVLNCTDNFLERFPPVPDDTIATRYRLSSRRLSDEVPQLPPLSRSLESLYVAGNRLGDDIYQSLYLLPCLTILSMADNLITDLAPWFISDPHPGLKLSWFGRLRELYLSGNNISAIPPEVGNMIHLRWLFLNGNRLPTVAHELSKISNLAALDLGTQLGSRGEGNALRYNVNNVPYEWNWNLNRELRYLNFSGNKRLEIKASSAPVYPTISPLPSRGLMARSGSSTSLLHLSLSLQSQQQQHATPPSTPNISDLADFSQLKHIRVLGLMDVNCTINVLEETEERRVRTTSSDLALAGLPGGVIRYGVADVLSRPAEDRNSNMVPVLEDSGFFSTWDLVVPQFRGREHEALFGLFDGRGTRGGAKLGRRLFENFPKVFQMELNRVENDIKKFNNSRGDYGLPIVLEQSAIEIAIRKTFLTVNKMMANTYFNATTKGHPMARKGSSSSIDEEAANSLENDPYRKLRKRSDGQIIPATEIYGCSGVIAYLYSTPIPGSHERTKTQLYIANVGDCVAVLSKTGGQANVLSRHHGTNVDTLGRPPGAFLRVKSHQTTSVQSSMPGSPISPSAVPDVGDVPVSSSVVLKYLPMVDDPSPQRSFNRQDLFWRLAELQRVHESGGWLSSSSLINGLLDMSRAFGYYEFLGPITADPAIRMVELDVGDDDMDKASVMSGGSTDLGPGTDEFVVLTSGAVWRAMRCAGTYEDGAQKIVEVARSTFGGLPDASGSVLPGMIPVTSHRLGGMYLKPMTGDLRRPSNVINPPYHAPSINYPAVGGTAMGSTSWSTAASKVRDYALSLGGTHGPDEHGGGYLVMILGLQDLARRAAWYNAVGPRRRSSASGESTILEARRGSAVKKDIEPPFGRLALVFTDIKSSTELWERQPKVMQRAIRIHNAIMRDALRRTGGYEVKTEGDAFMVAFQSMLPALEFCLTVQTQLVRADWPAEILSAQDGQVVWHDDVDTSSSSSSPANSNSSSATATFDEHTRLVLRGLSVRMGIHFGTPLGEADPITGRMDYFGPMVNRAARIAARAQGGQILMSFDAMREFKRRFSRAGGSIEKAIRDGEDFTDRVRPADADVLVVPPGRERDDEIARIKKQGMNVWNIGEVQLKGLETPELLHAIYPRDLAIRHSYILLLIGHRYKEIEKHTLHLQPLDPNEVKQFGNVLLRLEDVQSGGTGTYNADAKNAWKYEWKLDKSVESDRDSLVDTLLEIVERLEMTVEALGKKC
ncbi:hypothetical protein SmJEL517_g01834 [Synchytrium microbalum]|uniref:Adenylate cyclase n=1 Tax=Synchytrium microbalum TaxID=1806994 RepID=A0A507CD62_9FUNG|nr:uncharacterized protein SmJEL517_g01834 [Synchytrium microbalum]TPX35986.1 hypothetical protein SmJEL517_g01834 [Synchytrium microbalum]